MGITKTFFALMGATLLSANALADPEAPSLVDYDVNGDGTIAEGEKAYELKSADDLYWFANYVNDKANAEYKDGGYQSSANAVLTANITINENLLESLAFDENGNVTNDADFKAWFPIGYYIPNPYTKFYFGGTFDGNGHTISGLYFNNEGQSCVGLFGQINGVATIKNVGIADSYIKGGSYIGGVCGANYYATITNCYNTGKVSGGNKSWDIGGVCGYNSKGHITNCYNSGKVSGGDKSYNIGGVCGANEGTIENCYNSGEVSGGDSSYKIGGVCGYNIWYATITNCYNTSKVSGGDGSYNIGGVCGYNDGGTIKNCYYLASIDDGNGGKTADQFADGTVAQALRNGTNGNVWGQNIDTDKSPTLTGNYALTQITAENREKYNLSEDYVGYYAISNADELYWFAGLVNGKLIGVEQNKSANAVLTADITVNKDLLKSLAFDENGNVTNDADFKAWFPIGYYIQIPYTNIYYSGTFDGNGHTISGLYFNNPNVDYVGLFGQISEGATVKNVGVIDSYFEGSYYVGGVCGWNKGTIANCYSASDANGSNNYIGGVCGYNYEGTIENCYNTDEISGGVNSQYIGGVCGYNYEGTIEKCYNTGKVEGSNYIGGVCGYNEGTIENCYYLNSSASEGIGAGETTAQTAEQFASGEVAYKLGGAFFQTIGEDASPVLDSIHGKVYQTSPCGIAYSNTENVVLEHNFDENGFCTACGAYEPATDSDADGYYEIANAGNLYWFANYVNQGGDNAKANAVLTADITINKDLLESLAFDENGNVTNGETFDEWFLIGYDNNDGSDYVDYAGTFDGKDHTISGLYFNNPSACCVGLFGAINGATIKNIGVVDSYIKGESNIGGVCGYNYYGTITNCYNTGKVSGGDGSYDIGGVCGYNDGTITNCYNSGEVSGGDNSEYIGGVCGYNDDTITNCYDFKLNSGTLSEYSIVVENNTIALPTEDIVSREGYEFGGWCTDEACEGEGITSEAEFNDVHTLYAKWIGGSTPTAIKAIKAVEAESNKTIKTIKDGQIVIIRDGVMYDMQGRKL